MQSTSATFFHDIFTNQAASPTATASDLRTKIEETVKEIKRTQQDYQPFYGLGDDMERSPRRDLLLQSVDLVASHFSHVKRKEKVRILDVGCNNGFVSFKLAETFHLTRGIDINPVSIMLCQQLAHLSGSPARFSNVDLLNVFDEGDADTENVDCILLLNVVHQIIFLKGLTYVQNLLSRLARNVDVIFIELARKEDYVQHKLDHLLPENPRVILDQISGCSIELVKSEGRPLYKICRKEARFGRISISPTITDFSLSPIVHESRKYYSGGGQFLKLFRFTKDQSPSSFVREKRALSFLQGNLAVPQIVDWVLTPTYGAILMESVAGRKIADGFDRYASEAGIRSFISEYLSLAASLGDHHPPLFHNDLSPHNIYVLPAGGLRFVDFEQADERAYLDPFAVMLWAVYDVITRDIKSYRRDIYRHLRNPIGTLRVEQEHYPDFGAFEIAQTSWFKAFYKAAIESKSWFEFAREWRSARHETLRSS